MIGNSAGRFLEYIIIRNAAQKFIKNHDVPRPENVPLVPTFCQKRVSTAKGFRNLLIQNKSAEPCAVHFWKRKCNIEMTKATWLNAFSCTKETRLRLLQWKLMHNIYPTNIMLSKMKVRENNKCSYCTDVVDVIEHFFFECQIIREFWIFIEYFITDNLHKSVKLKTNDVLFGIVSSPDLNKRELKRINHILLIAKMCISIFKKTNSRSDLKQIFENHLQIRNM